MVEVKKMNKGNKSWSQPPKNLQKMLTTLDKFSHCIPDVQLRQHSLVQPLLDFQAHPQQRHEPGVPKRFE